MAAPRTTETVFYALCTGLAFFKLQKKNPEVKSKDWIAEAKTLWEKCKDKGTTISQLIGQMKKAGEDATDIIAAMKKISDEIKSLDDEYKDIEAKLQNLLLNIPNIPHESVPEGLSSDKNVEVRTFGEKPAFSFPVKPHWELGKDLGILDFERASKLAGSRFAIYLGAGALLERAL